jgi:hypothetical protein
MAQPYQIGVHQKGVFPFTFCSLVPALIQITYHYILVIYVCHPTCLVNTFVVEWTKKNYIRHYSADNYSNKWL